MDSAILSNQKGVIQNWKVHFLFWHLYIFIAFNSFLISEETSKFFDVYTHNILAILLCFYGTFYFLRLAKRLKLNLAMLVLLYVVSFILFFSSREILNILLNYFKIASYNDHSKSFYLDAFIIWFFFGGIGTGFFFAIDTIEKQNAIIHLEKEQYEREKQINIEKNRVNELIIENQRVELAKLNSQINPHFLFNTLNFFYSEIRLLHPKVAESILLLSDIMRYSLNDSGPTIRLEGEIEYVKSYIKLQKNRFSDRIYLEIEIVGEDEIMQKTIPSMTLITLIENCFKYGDLKDPQNPCKISIEISDNRFQYTSINKILIVNSAIKSSGLGLNNIKSRLEMVYNNNFVFESKKEDNNYICVLIIDYK